MPTWKHGQHIFLLVLLYTYTDTGQCSPCGATTLARQWQCSSFTRKTYLRWATQLLSHHHLCHHGNLQDIADVFTLSSVMPCLLMILGGGWERACAYKGFLCNRAWLCPEAHFCVLPRSRPEVGWGRGAGKIAILLHIYVIPACLFVVLMKWWLGKKFIFIFSWLTLDCCILSTPESKHSWFIFTNAVLFAKYSRIKPHEYKSVLVQQLILQSHPIDITT